MGDGARGIYSMRHNVVTALIAGGCDYIGSGGGVRTDGEKSFMRKLRDYPLNSNWGRADENSA